jgi:3-hydroxypropionyl-CoA synthetase (ADP-forming)
MANRQADFDTAKAILESVGIPVLGCMVHSREEALATASSIGYPVVLKLVSPDVVHKTDVGAVLLGLETPDAVSSGYDTVLENARKVGTKTIDGVLVQKFLPRGFELLVGAGQDPLFGPVTMVGYGGRYVELFKDVAPGIGILEPTDVEAMLANTLAGRVIDGFRGPPLDRAAVVDLVVRISKLMESHPDLVELDLNPVVLYEKGFAIVDARLIFGAPVVHPRAEDISPARMRSLQAIFDARSVAIVGASKPGTVGGVILKNSGRIPRLYPINPRYEVLSGRKCYKALTELPEVPEVAVFAVAPETAIRCFREFCELGGKGAIIVSDGFAEIGRNDLEEELTAISRKHGVVYVGPNGLGVVDNFSGLNTIFLPMRRTEVVVKPGPIAVISQSGGIGLEFLEMLAADNLSVGKWVSCGNASGINIPELLAHMGDDPRIKVIAIYLEGLRNGLQFVEVGKRIAARKPVIVIKGGVAGGAAATMSHTASLAGSHVAFQAACRQAGFYLVEELTEDPKILANVLSMLVTQKPARGNRIGVVSVGGGAAILLADQITAQGMTLAEFTPRTRTALVELLSPKLRTANGIKREMMAARIGVNPVDLFGDADDDRLLEAVRLLNRDQDTDVVVVALYLQVPGLSEYFEDRLVELSLEMTKPLIISPRGFSRHVMLNREFLTQNNVRTYTVPMTRPLSIVLDIWKRYPEINFTAP